MWGKFFDLISEVKTDIQAGEITGDLDNYGKALKRINSSKSLIDKIAPKSAKKNTKK